MNTTSTGIDARISMTSEEEVKVLKSVFQGNEALLKSIRLFLYGLSVSDADKLLIKTTFANLAVYRAFRKKIYPIFEEDIPDVAVNSLMDFWYGTEVNVNGKDRDTITQNLNAKVKVKKMFEQAFNLLKNFDGEKIDLSYEPSELDPLGIGLIARNLYIRTINEGVNIIKMIIDQKDETPEEIKKRLAQNSNK